jgi:mRNA interferase RelE/StbE
MKTITVTPAAVRQWLELSAATRKRIDGNLTGYGRTASGDVKRLKGRDGCRLRVGDWRVIFIEDAKSITVVAVGHRKDIYE